MSAMQNRISKTLVMAATLVALGAVTGCHKKTSGVNPNTLGPAPAAAAVPTATITADPAAIDLGQSVVLNWRSQNASAVSISGIGDVNLNGTHTARAALVSDGVPANRLRVISYGKEKQFCTDETESCWQQNRRAQFSLDR